jgi:hypothetical protein
MVSDADRSALGAVVRVVDVVFECPDVGVGADVGMVTNTDWGFATVEDAMGIYHYTGAKVNIAWLHEGYMHCDKRP